MYPGEGNSGLQPPGAPRKKWVPHALERQRVKVRANAPEGELLGGLDGRLASGGASRPHGLGLRLGLGACKAVGARTTLISFSLHASLSIRRGRCAEKERRVNRFREGQGHGSGPGRAPGHRSPPNQFAHRSHLGHLPSQTGTQP